MRKNTLFLVPLLMMVVVLAGCNGKQSMPSGMPADPTATMPQIDYPAGSIPADKLAIPPVASQSKAETQVTETVIGSAPVVEPGTATINLIAQDNVFKPEVFTVKKGTTVKLTVSLFSSKPEVAYDFSLSGHEADATLKSGESASFEFVADRAGTFPYTTEGLPGEEIVPTGKMVVID